MMDKPTIKAWYQASRPPFFVATMIPLILGGVLASSDGYWDWSKWLVTLLASFFVHLNTNLANDYFEHVGGADEGEAIGGSRVIQEGKISPRQIVMALFLLYSLALLCGLWLLYVTREWLLVPIMAFSFFSSLFYVGPPVRYGYHGLGELLVGINMGPVMVAGTHLVLTGSLSMQAVLLSLPVGLMVALILFYQSLPDMKDDEAVSKITLAVSLGRRGAVLFYRLAVGAVLLTILALVWSGNLPLPAIASLVTIFPALAVDRMITSTADWKDLHHRGGKIRLFYLLNGLILIFSIILFG
jgi:1,4-dihydroxy-2-naphthoate polyprenyltransferase